MPNFKVAHINEQGVDLIIIPLEQRSGILSQQEQNATIAELQVRANGVGLRGTVVPVWDAGGGQMAFIAPNQWHAFLGSLNLPLVMASLNREIFWQ